MFISVLLEVLTECTSEEICEFRFLNTHEGKKHTHDLFLISWFELRNFITLDDDDNDARTNIFVRQEKIVLYQI